jgi:hypothetical protein
VSADPEWRRRRERLARPLPCQLTAVGAPVPALAYSKGLVERFHDYLDRAFLPGRVFASPADFNTRVRFNHRPHRTLGHSPGVRVEADDAARLSLPPVPSGLGCKPRQGLARDHYMRLEQRYGRLF